MRARTGDWFGVFTVVGEWGLSEGCQRRAFPSAWVEMRQEGKAEGKLKSCQ